MPEPKLDALLLQPRAPAAQERRGLLVHGEHAPARADERFDAEPFHPGTQVIREEIGQQNAPARIVAIARDELFQRLGMCQVEAAATRNEELAAHRRHPVGKDGAEAGCRCQLRRAQTGGSAADDENVAGIAGHREFFRGNRYLVEVGLPQNGVLSS